jgi:acetone carboxylase, beta subunit
VTRQIAIPLGLSDDEAAGGIVDLFEEQLRYAALARVLGKGYSPVDYTLLCYGGGGPLHVAGYTRDAGYADVLVPTWAAGFSAFGCACADFSYRFDQTTSLRLDRSAASDIAAVLSRTWAELGARAVDAFAASGIPEEQISLRRMVRMQYAGQLNDIEVRARDDDPEDLDALIASFEESYAKLYAGGARSPELGYAVTSVVLVGSAPVEKPALPDDELVAGPATPVGERPVWWRETDGFTTTPIFDQDSMHAGEHAVGPAIVESPSATFAIPPGRVARLDSRRIFHLANA